MKSWFFWILLLFSLKDNLLHAQDYNSILSLMIYKCVSPAWTFPVSCRPPQPTPHHTSHLLSLSQPHTVCVTLSFRAPSASMCTKPETRCLSHSPHFMSQWAILRVRFFHPLLLPPPGPRTQTSCQRLSHGSWLWEPPSWHPPTHPCLKWALQATDLCYHPFHQNSSFCLEEKSGKYSFKERGEGLLWSGPGSSIDFTLSTLLSLPAFQPSCPKMCWVPLTHGLYPFSSISFSSAEKGLPYPTLPHSLQLSLLHPLKHHFFMESFPSLYALSFLFVLRSGYSPHYSNTMQFFPLT